MIFYFCMEAIPDYKNRKFRKWKGAFINCWVESTDMELAFIKVTEFIKSEGWSLKAVKENVIVRREDYEDDLELIEPLKCFKKALRDGICVVYHIWKKPTKKLIQGA